MTRWFDSVTRENNQEDVDTVLYPLEIWMIFHYIELCQRTRLCSHKSKITIFFQIWFGLILIHINQFWCVVPAQNWDAKIQSSERKGEGYGWKSPKLISSHSLRFTDSHESVEFLGHTNHLRIGRWCLPQHRIKTPLFLGKVTRGHYVLLFHSFDLFNVFAVLVLGMVWKRQYAAEMSWNLSKIDTHGAIDSMIIFPLWECKA